MTALRAVVFDLYGTLIHVRKSPFRRGGPRLVGATGREWAELLRERLLVRPFAGRGEFVAAIVDRFLPAGVRTEADRATAGERLLDLLARELDSAESEPSARSVLGFLRRRGLRLALLTNSASPFREPFQSTDWAELFDAVLFSCDLGSRKPAPEVYRAALAALEVAPEEALSVGDSLANDVASPRALGMAAVGIGAAGGLPGVERFADLAWLAGFESGKLESLLPLGRHVALGDLAGTITKVDLLPDGRQGRYNLVAEVEVSWEAGFRECLFVKRFRHPEAVWIEEFIRPLLAEVGVATNRVAILEGAEPLLVAREVTGTRLRSSPPDPPLAHEIGRHFGAAFLFSNADIRPRNMLLVEIAGRPCLTALDYEYVLFDRALDFSDLAFRYDPKALARLPREELLARGSRRVLSRAAIFRGRREFLDSRTASAESVAAFRSGWSEVHAAARSAASRIEELLRARLDRDPPLVVGTEAYRRALLPLDVDDVLERVAMTPEAACDQAF